MQTAPPVHMASVYGQIRDIQHAEGNIHADGHDTPDQSLGTASGQRIDQIHNVHIYDHLSHYSCLSLL